MIRLILCLFLLFYSSLPAMGQDLLTSWNQLTLVGGFRVPEALIDGVNTVSTTGSFDKLPGANRWIATHGTVSSKAVEFTEPAEPNMSFPELVQGRNAGPFFLDTDNMRIGGVQWIDANDIIVSARQYYRAASSTWGWVATANLDSGVISYHDVGHVDDSANWAESPQTGDYLFSLHQSFGSGFMRIPSTWAAAYAGGKTIGMAAGGYDVLGSPMGPTAAAYAIGDALPLILMDYPTTAAFNGTTTNTYEIRDTNYSFPTYLTTPLALWSSSVNDFAGAGTIDTIQSNPLLTGPTGAVGYFTADEPSHGAGWIDNANYKGIVYGVYQPNGYLEYDAQSSPGSGEMFLVYDNASYYDANYTSGHYIHDESYLGGPDGTYTNSLYVYDPDCFAEVAASTRDDWGCTPTIISTDFSNLPFTLDYSAKDGSKIAGVTWDSDRNYLWLTITAAHDSNKYAILVAYKVGVTTKATFGSGTKATFGVGTAVNFN